MFTTQGAQHAGCSTRTVLNTHAQLLPPSSIRAPAITRKDTKMEEIVLKDRNMEEILKKLDRVVKDVRKKHAVATLPTMSYRTIGITLRKHPATSNQLYRLDHHLKQMHDRSKAEVLYYSDACETILKEVKSKLSSKICLLQPKVLTMAAPQVFLDKIEGHRRKYYAFERLKKTNLLNCRITSSLRKKVKAAMLQRTTVDDFIGGATPEENRRRVYQKSVEKEWEDRKVLMKTMQHRVKISKLRF